MTQIKNFSCKCGSDVIPPAYFILGRYYKYDSTAELCITRLTTTPYKFLMKRWSVFAKRFAQLASTLNLHLFFMFVYDYGLSSFHTSIFRYTPCASHPMLLICA